MVLIAMHNSKNGKGCRWVIFITTSNKTALSFGLAIYKLHL